MVSRRSLLAAGGGAVAASTLPSGTAFAATYVPPPARQRIDLNAGWRFIRSDVSGAQDPAFNDSGWTAVTVPHTWNAADGQDGGANYYRGIGWYRRHYTPPASFAGKKLWLQFAGANQVADVWVNGVSLGQHRGGYARFRFDATAALKLGQDNVIAVRVNNANNPDIAPLSADFTFFGGIYRNVSLQVVDPLSARMLDSAGPGVYLRQTSVSAASATVVVHRRGVLVPRQLRGLCRGRGRGDRDQLRLGRVAPEVRPALLASLHLAQRSRRRRAQALRRSLHPRPHPRTGDIRDRPFGAGAARFQFSEQHRGAHQGRVEDRPGIASIELFH
jgi:Glycosyl hydrolases family 2, sugar binding domain